MNEWRGETHTSSHDLISTLHIFLNSKKRKQCTQRVEEQHLSICRRWGHGRMEREGAAALGPLSAPAIATSYSGWARPSRHRRQEEEERNVLWPSREGRGSSLWPSIQMVTRFLFFYILVLANVVASSPPLNWCGGSSPHLMWWQPAPMCRKHRIPPISRTAEEIPKRPANPVDAKFKSTILVQSCDSALPDGNGKQNQRVCIVLSEYIWRPSLRHSGQGKLNKRITITTYTSP